MKTTILILVALAACQPGESMNDKQQAQHKVSILSTSEQAQYGQSLQMRTSTSNSAMASVAKDLVRWKGVSESDIQPVRVYLGPWQPNPQLQGVALNAGNVYATPTPWAEPPNVYDSMISEGQLVLPGPVRQKLYAKVMFGAGGVQHVAYVDWPPRGLLFQIGASYVQIDAVGDFTPAGGVVPEQLPLLRAHIAPEPGGGDAANPGTFTYPVSDTAVNTSLVFQVPPFARAFTPLIPRAVIQGAPFSVATMTFDEYTSQNNFLNIQHVWSVTTGSDFPDDRPVPISGMTANIRVSAFTSAPVSAPVRCGMLFYLDL